MGTPEIKRMLKALFVEDVKNCFLVSQGYTISGLDLSIYSYPGLSQSK